MRTPIDEELKKYWELANELKNMICETEKKLESQKGTLRYFKGKIRELNSLREEYAQKHEDNWRCRYPDDGYGDSVYVKYKLPYHLSEEEKQEFINSEWCKWYNPYNDGRDCTGVWFTSRIRVIDCGENETIIIHCKNCDV